MTMKYAKIIKIGAISGFLIPVIFVIMLALAIHLNPWFSFHKNALSDLGSLRVPTRYIFNIGLIVIGVLGIVFSLAFSRYLKLLLVHILTVAMMFLVMVGIFPEDYGIIHSLPALLFYALSLTGIFYSGIVFRRKNNRAVSFFSMFGSVATFILMISLIGKYGLAVPETIGAAFILSWIVLISYKMLKMEE